MRSLQSNAKEIETLLDVYFDVGTLRVSEIPLLTSAVKCRASRTCGEVDVVRVSKHL